MTEFMELVKQMRTAQKNYFKGRDHAVLMESKRLEREVDDFIEREESGQPDLFLGQGK